jgi:glycosyltransferase involved in cell wall biosynthesis
MKVFVVIPAYNEEGRVGRVVEDALRQDLVSKVVVVDDCSSDNTAKEAEEAGAFVVRHFKNMGVGGAIKMGYRLFLKEGGDVAVVVAGDGQHDSSEIPRFVEAIASGEAEYVVGDRTLQNDSMPYGRRLGNKLLSWLTRRVTGLDVRDSQFGFCAISADSLKRINLEYITNSWGYPNDMLAECAVKNVQVKFIPSRCIYGGRKSYIRLLPYILRVGTILCRGWLRKLYYYHGIYLFSLSGLISLFIGIVYGAYLAIRILQLGQVTNIGSLILVAVLLIGGIQMVLFGFLMDMIKRVESTARE